MTGSRGAVEIAERTLRRNWTEGSGHGRRFAYTQAQPRPLPLAVVLGLLLRGDRLAALRAGAGPSRARDPAGAQRPDGFIGHTIFWERPVSWTRLPFYNVSSRRSMQTETIQPPLLAWAWRIAVGDPAAEPRIAAQADWLSANRDFDGDGLLWILQPDESGLDASPKFEPVWGWKIGGRLGFPLLVQHNRRLGFDARRVLERGGPLLCETEVNVLWCLSLQALGRPSITPALVERLYDESRGLFFDEVRPGGRRPPVSTWTSLAPLALPDLPEEIGRRLVEEHLLDPRAVLDPGRSALGLRRGAELPARGQPGPASPVLARADLDQLGLADLAGPAPPRLPARGRTVGRRPRRGGEPRRPARVLRPARRQRPRRSRLRLVGADRRDGRPGPRRGSQPPLIHWGWGF